jgi:monoamine oxidase
MQALRQAALQAGRDAVAERDSHRPATPVAPLDRRTVLRGAAMTAAAGFLPAPARGAGVTIAVVGAGLAGLTAAYELKKAGHIADVFEGNTRIGGRCWTSRGDFANGQIAEHGGELIDTTHYAIRKLAATLGLKLDNVFAAIPPGTTSLYRFNGKPYTTAQATKDFDKIYNVLKSQSKAIGNFDFRHSTAAAKKYDAMSISQWIGKYVPGGRASQFGQLIENAFTEENSADADQQSALNMIQTISEDPKKGFDLYYTDSNQHYHVRGGNDQIPTLLTHALDGRVVTGMALIAIRRLSDGRFALTFARDRGTVTHIYDRVVMAIPFSVMRVAVDFRHAGFRPLKETAIRTLPMGVAVKFQMQFNKRVWYERGCSGEIRLKASGFQTTWDVTRAQPGDTGIFNFWSGGTQALVAGEIDNPTLAGLVTKEAGVILPGLGAAWNGMMIKNAWQLNPWSYGSYCVYPPGYQTTVVGVEALPEGNCFFAGEHTAVQNGFLNAAVETGQRAARQVIASL